jgi:DNA-binding SARP family transcriptional activator
MSNRRLATAQDRRLASGTRWRLRLLDGFCLTGPSGPVSLQPAAARLLALLAMLEVPAPRSRVASTLWLETTDRQAGANLRSLLWRVQQRHEDLLEVTFDGVRLSDCVSTDLWSCRVRARAILEDRLEPEPGDISLMAAELLPDWYDEWVIMQRERERQRRLHALEALCVWFSRQGRHALGLDAGLAAIAADPLRESAHRTVIAAHLAEGNGTEALRQYRHYARLLEAEMGLHPSAEMRRLVMPLLSDQARVAPQSAARTA